MSARLKIMTWNVFMMPPWTFQSPSNPARARAIARELSKLDYDIVCFEKAFDPKARQIFRELLGSRYPHRYGPANGDSWFKLSSGVYVFSRLPLTGYREIEFDESTGVESFSAKGAMLLGGNVEGHAFQLIATHLQGDDSPRYEPSHQKIRNRQMDQIKRELVDRYVRPDAVLLLAGDFCTPRQDPNDPFVESSGYRHLVGTFSAINGDAERITLDDNRVRNDMATDNAGRVAELDYVLLRPNGHLVQGEWERHVIRHPWEGPNRRTDLSYRYAVGATFNFA